MPADALVLSGPALTELKRTPQSFEKDFAKYLTEASKEALIGAMYP